MKILAPPDQKYECRDCPARCCRVPWNIRFSEEETARYVAEPWVQVRAGVEGLRVIARGVLPMREHDRRLQCVFLDEDERCGLQKKFGHDYIPRSCQAFPFGFTRNEKGGVTAGLSLLCPSIRENYGEPVERQLRVKAEQKGAIERMSTAMSTTSRVVLPQAQYLEVARAWDAELAVDRSPAETLARIYDLTSAFEAALPAGEGKVSDAAVKAALARARDGLEVAPLAPRAGPSFQARVLYAYLLGNLSYPSRVRQAHRVGPAPAALGVRSFGNKLAWLRGGGTVDLLFLPRPVALGRVRRVPTFLAAAEGAIVRDYLRLVLERRQVFAHPRYLLDVVVDLALATVLVSRFARCAAVAHERETVAAADVREGLSVAELVLLSHVTLAEEGTTMKNLRVLLLGDRERFRQLLASEA